MKRNEPKERQPKISKKFRVKGDITHRIIDNEAAIVRPSDGTLIILNESGTFIFKNLVRGLSPERIIKKIVQEFDVDPERAERDLNSFLRVMKREAIIEEV
jgi:hypothetical protein